MWRVHVHLISWTAEVLLDTTDFQKCQWRCNDNFLWDPASMCSSQTASKLVWLAPLVCTIARRLSFCVHGFFCVSVIWTRPDWLLLQNARRRVTSADLAIGSRAFLVISIGRKVGSSTGQIEQTFSFRPRVKRAKDAQSARCHGRFFDGASCTNVLMDVIICNAVATLCLLDAVSRGKCVVAAIFLRNGDRHLDGVAILVLLVRCSGTQWYGVRCYAFSSSAWT